MSMLGDIVGCTSEMAIEPVVKNWVKMSLRLLATMKRSTGRPIWRATWPANTLPKLPVGTEKDT